MDFGSINLSAQAELHVRDINGRLVYQDNGEPMTITLLSDDAEPVRRQERAALNRRFANPSKIKLKMEDLEEEALDKLAVATVEWAGFTRGGEPIPCEFHEIRKLYSEHRWLREQVDQFIGDRANFLTGSPSS